MVNHRIGEYVRGDVSTNQAESYFAQLKRSLDGTHHHVSRVHLHRYVAEFDFRYTTCKLDRHRPHGRDSQAHRGTAAHVPRAHFPLGTP